MNSDSAWSEGYTAEDYYNQVQKPYDDLLGPDAVDELFPFVPLMHEYRGDALRRYRLWVDTVTQGIGLEERMPNPPVASLVSGHYYATLPYTEGVLGDLLIAQRVGGTRQEVADILAMSFLHAGPYGMNLTARTLAPVMSEWAERESTPSPGIQWPEGWTVDASAFRCGVDFSTELPDNMEAAAAEVEQIEEWYRRVQGEVPGYVDMLAKHYPRALRAFRARYESSLAGSLPKQFIALCLVHLATCRAQPSAVRRGLHMARYFGVKRDHAVQIVTLGMLYLGDIGMDSAVQGIGDLLENWD